MASQQRNYRPPTSRARQTSLAGHEGPTVTYPAIQHLEISQGSSPAQQLSHPPPEPQPTPADQAANAITQQPGVQPLSPSHRIDSLLASTARPSLADKLGRFNTAIPTTSELSDFLNAIEQECLLRSIDPNAHATVSTGTVVQITLYLSGPLLQWSDSQSGRFRDLQLRALIAALALLHHSGLTELTAEPHEQLRLNIAARFNDIIDGRRASHMSLEDRIRKADALYLIRLVAQYFSLIKRAQPLSDAASIPIIGLVLAGASVAGGQYNGLSSAFRYADQVIGLIPGRKSRYLNLPAIQELTRNAITTFSLVETSSNNQVVSEDCQRALEVVQLVQQLLKVHIEDIPSTKSSVWDWPLARLRRGPPRMDKWYFFYGLLDCLAQVARHIRHGHLSVDLFSMLKKLMEESEYEELRWKILEIFEAYVPVRKNIHQWLIASHRDSNIDNAGVLLELAAIRATLGQPADFEAGSPISRQTTSSFGIDDGRYLPGDPGPSSQPIDSRQLHLTFGEAHHSDSIPGAQTADVDAIERIFTQQESILTRSTNEQERSSSLVSQQQRDTPVTEEEQEKEPEQYLEGYLDYWSQDGDVHESQLLPRGTFGRGSRDYAHAGLSTDCQLAFFSNSRKVCVTRVSLDNRRRRKEDVVLEREYDRKSSIADVSLLNDILAVSTRLNVELHRVGHPGAPVVIPHGEWDPLGIASWEQGSDAMVAETDSDGLTSVAIYQSPSQQPYIFCTTSASTERFRSEGEWPFTSPVSLRNEQVPRKAVHDLTALQDHRQLAAGAVSSITNKFVVLTKSGKIMILSLSGHEEGGICSEDNAPDILPVSLCALKSSRATPTCLRFDPTGTKLYAVDPEGKLIIVAFRPDD
ncbi:MAG: hypothetical protein Q9168_006984 [Polycauliona sp. 1 TL-2023]